MENFDENGDFTPEYRATFPEMLGDDNWNDPETKQKPTKELDGVKNVSDALKMVVNGSRKISAHGDELKKATEGFVKIPGEGAGKEEIAAYREAQGVPETADGYELNVPKEGGYDIIAAEVKAAAHEHGIAPSKLSPVWDKVVTALTAQVQAQEKAGMDLLAADVQALKDTKNEKYDSFIADTNRVAAHFDVKADAALGTKDNLIGTEFMKLMNTMGIKDTPVVREFLGRIAPLVLEGKTHVGAGAGDGSGKKWFTNYDETGQEAEPVQG